MTFASLASRFAIRWAAPAVACVGAIVAAGCSRETQFDTSRPQAGPGSLVGRDRPLNNSFTGGASLDIEARNLDVPLDWHTKECDDACLAYCRAQTFANPLDQALCPQLWGAGYDTLPLIDTETCRRVHADLTGRFPSLGEVQDECLGRPIGDTVLEWIKSKEFVFVNQRRWADTLRYNNVAVNLERIYDADTLVGKLYGGFVRYDEFVEVMSAHPVLVRRFDDPGDRAEELFNVFVGRPPFANERADMAKLYSLWQGGYYDHPDLGMRMPDSYIQHHCVNDELEIDAETAGACTSVLWGFNRVVLVPDFRAQRNEDGVYETWSGNLTKKEWQLLQTPGRIIGKFPQVWEHAVRDVLELYLGYDLGRHSPAAVDALVDYVLAHGGDIRAAHYAVATSAIYLQSTNCPDCDPEADVPPWTYGPLRQAEAEQWIDSITHLVDSPLGSCDFRIPDPNEILERSVLGYDLVEKSRWSITEEDRVDERYSSLAQTLGGCPDNQVSGRFKAISILNTATQEGFVRSLCNPGLEPDAGVPATVLLPGEVAPSAVLTVEVAEQIATHQYATFFGRFPSPEEVEMAQGAVAACVPKPCKAEAYSRSLCYALLSSSEMLFY
ncbi:MAG TPA: hypothetical protein VLC09_09975 [Polyangiaceae bacterium]|nr:hypothetical protein [Polyangiaceae bacterium]